MWKLPMFGCTDPSQVLKEIRACEEAFPNAYIRIVAFDNVRQVRSLPSTCALRCARLCLPAMPQYNDSHSVAGSALAFCESVAACHNHPTHMLCLTTQAKHHGHNVDAALCL